MSVFANIEEAFTATARPTLLYVRIGGVAVDATEASVQFGVDRPVGTCTVYMLAPRPVVVQMNATIEIEMGYPGASARRFIGFIPSDESVTDDRGHLVRIEGVGWASRLTYPEYAGIEIQGPVSLKDAFRSLCALRNIPTYLSDDTTTTDGMTTVMLGGNDLVNGGHIRIDNQTAPLSWLQRVPPAYGYRCFDSPDGAVRLARVSGLAHPEFGTQELTTDLVEGDYIVPRGSINFRSGPSTTFPVIAAVDTDTIGRVLNSVVVNAGGFHWMQLTFAGYGVGYSSIVNSLGVPNFYRQEPVEDAVRYEEGVNVTRIARQRDIRDMATYIEVKGARYTAGDGGVTEIRSIPDDVPYAAELDPPGYRKTTISLQDITTDEQAEWVRNATEVDRSAPYELLSWEAPGRPDLQPGGVVTLNAPTHGITMEDYWLMTVDESTNDAGYVGRYTGWRGSGRVLRAGDDCRIELIPGDSVIHCGTQTISWYRDPTPDSVRDPNETEKERKKRRWVVIVPFTISNADYSSLRLTGLCHGTNSIGNKTAITGSKVEIWQLADPSLPESGSNEMKRVGSVDFPTVDEEIGKRRNYASFDAFWTAFSLPLPGSIKVGPVEIFFVCGEQDGEVDDYEVTGLRLITCGVGQPALPGSIAA